MLEAAWGGGEMAVKQIILYGVRHVELRRDIEFFLDDGYEIIGYSDTWYTSDVLDGKRFIPLEQLRAVEFDYIIPLSFKEAVLADMESGLEKQGVSPEKIVRPTMFLHQGAEKMQVDLVRDLEAQYRGENLIFGLSYSLRGILKKKLRPAFYDCSWHGLDLYYNYRIFQHMRNRRMLSTAEAALLVFHYYCFDYDMSKTAYHYRTGQMFALRGLNDWHNYRQAPEGADCVANYQMFGRKISDFYHFQRYEHQNRGIYRGEDGKADLDGLWLRQYPETKTENIAVYGAFCQELRAEGIVPVLIVPPYYLSGLNQASLDAFEKKKESFYAVVEKSDIQIFDFSDVFADRRELFADLTHLNSDGAEEFTRILNEVVLEGARRGSL